MPFYPIGVRVQAVTLMALGFDIQHIEDITSMSSWTIKRWFKIAKERGFNPEIDKQVLTEYVEDAPQSGCPKEITQSTEQSIISSIKKDYIRYNTADNFYTNNKIYILSKF